MIIDIPYLFDIDRAKQDELNSLGVYVFELGDDISNTQFIINYPPNGDFSRIYEEISAVLSQKKQDLIQETKENLSDEELENILANNQTIMSHFAGNEVRFDEDNLRFEDVPSGVERNFHDIAGIHVNYANGALTFSVSDPEQALKVGLKKLEQIFLTKANEVDTAYRENQEEKIRKLKIIAEKEGTQDAYRQYNQARLDSIFGQDEELGGDNRVRRLRLEEKFDKKVAVTTMPAEGSNSVGKIIIKKGEYEKCKGLLEQDSRVKINYDGTITVKSSVNKTETVGKLHKNGQDLEIEVKDPELCKQIFDAAFQAEAVTILNGILDNAIISKRQIEGVTDTSNLKRLFIKVEKSEQELNHEIGLRFKKTNMFDSSQPNMSYYEIDLGSFSSLRAFDDTMRTRLQSIALELPSKSSTPYQETRVKPTNPNNQGKQFQSPSLKTYRDGPKYSTQPRQGGQSHVKLKNIPHQHL